MNRRQALSACAFLFPFAQDTSAQTTDRGIAWTTLSEPRMVLSYSFTAGTITISNKKRSVTVSIDEIMDALDPQVKP